MSLECLSNTKIITVHVPEQHGTIKVWFPQMVPATTSGPRTNYFDGSCPGSGQRIILVNNITIN